MVAIILFVLLHIDRGCFLSLPSKNLLFCNVGCEFNIDWSFFFFFLDVNLEYLGVSTISRAGA
jgi:hypothetical protein